MSVGAKLLLTMKCSKTKTIFNKAKEAKQCLTKVTPPRGLDEEEARTQATEMLADIMADMMLKSNAPEEIKLGVRVIQQGKKVSVAVREIIDAFAGDPATIKASDTETLKRVLEYLGLVEVGLKQFMETTKAQM